MQKNQAFMKELALQSLQWTQRTSNTTVETVNILIGTAFPRLWKEKYNRHHVTPVFSVYLFYSIGQ